MAFDLEKLFVDVFSPRNGEVVTLMQDVPTDTSPDTTVWRERRDMARSWHAGIAALSEKYGISVNSLLTYPATGTQNGELPETGELDGQRVKLADVIGGSTIVIAMTEFSASAPLFSFVKAHEELRVASMPGCEKRMEETGLSADYKKIAVICEGLAPHFERGDLIEVEFSTGHTCRFDISGNRLVFQDTGLLPPVKARAHDRLANLPAGEVCVNPEESRSSRTSGEIPVAAGDEILLFRVEHNQIVGVIGEGTIASEFRAMFDAEEALRNIAEVAIGCNDRAVVTGNVLEDEKAGFHWAYGRSEHLGGSVGPDAFSSPERIRHMDIVYAKDNPVVCRRLDFVDTDGGHTTAVLNGGLVL
jgi:hypothetical protein